MSTRTELRSGKHAVAAVCIGFAIVYFVIGLVRHDGWLTVAGPLIMVGYLALLLAFRSRSESVALLAGAKGDERQRQVNLRAGAATGNVLVLAVVIGFCWSLAVGATAATAVLSGLGALAGVTYALAVFWFARHT
jgi:hypothetical protein